MPHTTSRRIAQGVVLASSIALVLDLSLDWQAARVMMGGIVDVRAGSSGWAGIGAIAGLAAIGVIVAELARLAGRGERPVLVLGGALTALAATVPAVVATRASTVDMSWAMRVDANVTRWPAWTGLGLATLAAGAALYVVAVSPRPGSRTAPADGAAHPGRRPAGPPAPRPGR
jgi:hypothetical protein